MIVSFTVCERWSGSIYDANSRLMDVVMIKYVGEKETFCHAVRCPKGLYSINALKIILFHKLRDYLKGN